MSLFKDPVDIAFVCVKSYDTIWATQMISQYLTPGGFIITLQNGINEERIASVVGWGRVLGCIAQQHQRQCLQARVCNAHGATWRTGIYGARAGEVHGRITPRLEEFVKMLSNIDSAKATTNLWGERWTKLVVNSMGNGVSAITGLGGGYGTQP